MTNDYTHVQLKRQEELTRAIQGRLGEVKRKANDQETALAQHKKLASVGGIDGNRPSSIASLHLLDPLFD